MSEPASDLDDWERHLCAPMTGRKIISSFELLAGMTMLVQRLQRWGADRPLLLADGRGTGPIPDESDADVIMLDTPRFESLTEQVRARMVAGKRLTPEVISAIEAYDPHREAAWWVSPVGLNTPMLGRDVMGGRPPGQAQLEDKLIVDPMLDEIGAAVSPTAISPTTYDELMHASRHVMAESGTDQVVWAGDSKHGTNGGCDYVRWVRNQKQAQDASVFFAKRCDEVRVSPFLEGVPCSIHGICLPDGVVVLRPVELATLRDPQRGRFVSGGLGTSWAPPDADAVEMRSIARHLGEFLQRTKGYRGGFGLDGVLTTDGFRPTEFNPRFSGGLTRLARAAPDAQLELVHINALIDRDVAKSAHAIEELACRQLEDNRFVDVLGLSPATVIDEHTEVPVAAGEGQLERAETDDTIIGSVTAGPSPLGSFFRLITLEGIIRPGERVAPLSILLLEFADRTWNAGFGSSLMAPDVRT